MECREMEGVLLKREEALAASEQEEVRKHLKGCQMCRELNVALNPPAVSGIPAEMLDRIEKRLVADLRAVRPLWPREYFLVGFGAAFVAIVWTGMYALGANGLRAMSAVQLSAVLLVTAASVAVLSDSLVRQMAPGNRHWMRPEFLPAIVIALLLGVMAIGFKFQHEPEFWVRGWICLRAGFPFALLAALPFWFLLRRGSLLTKCTTGVVAGLLAGLAGTSLLELHCPILDAAHILAWHAGISVLGTLIGAGLGFAAERAARGA